MPVEIADTSGMLRVGLRELRKFIGNGEAPLKLFDSGGGFSYPNIPLVVEDEGETVRVVIPSGRKVFMWSTDEEFYQVFSEDGAWITSTEEGGFLEPGAAETQVHVLEMNVPFTIGSLGFIRAVAEGD